MVINFEIRPSRPQNWLLLEILSNWTQTLAQEGLQTAPRASVFWTGTCFSWTGPKKHSGQMAINSGGWLSSLKPLRGKVIFWSDSVFWSGPKETDSYAELVKVEGRSPPTG